MNRALTKGTIGAGLAMLVLGLAFLASENPSVDALAYANEVAQRADYVYVHHVLHGIAGRFIWLPILGIVAKVWQIKEAYIWLAWSNALGFGMLLYLLTCLLPKKQVSVPPSVLFVVPAWGLLRYTVEFEAYVWPLVFVVLALAFLKEEKWTWAGLAFLVALLFHQISLVWIIPALAVVLLARGGIRALRLAWPLLLTIPAYFLAWKLAQSTGSPPASFLGFLFGEFGNGGVKADYDIQTLGLMAVSVVRTWVQVHGYQLAVFTSQPLLALKLASAGVVGAAAFAGFGLKATQAPNAAQQQNGEENLVPRMAAWTIPALLVGALWAQGNAEFLVGLPVAVALAYSSFLEKRRKAIVILSALLFGWNLAYGLLPQRLLTLSPFKAEGRIAKTPGPALATYHKLEVDTWAGVEAKRPVLHAQYMTSRGGQFYYFNKPIADTVLLLEQMPPLPYSRAGMLEESNKKAIGMEGTVVEIIRYLGDSARIVEVKAFD